MSIKRDDLDAGRVDFSEVATGKRLPLIHPGEILRDDFLQPMKISVYALAQAIKVPRSRVNDIVLGCRGVTAAAACRRGTPVRRDGARCQAEARSRQCGKPAGGSDDTPSNRLEKLKGG